MQATQREIVSFVETHGPEQIEFVINLCDQNSYTHNKAGTDHVAEMVLPHLTPILPFHRVVAEDDVGQHHVLRNRADGKAIYLVGHLDTVFPPDHEFQKCRLDDDILYGPGTCDMKGGIAVIVYALRALEAAGALDGISIAVILNADEEIGSTTSRSLFEGERDNALACLVAECAGNNGELVTSRNGKMGARIDSYGQDRHVSDGTHEKASAVLELAHQIIALESLNASQPGLSVNVGKVEGGLGSSTIPGQASALLEIRWADETHRTILEDTIAKTIPEHSRPGCRSTFIVLNARPAMPAHEGTKRLYNQVEDAGHVLGVTVRSEHRRGTSDANFFGAAGVPTVDGFGPVGFRDHTAEEHILIPSLRQRTLLLAHVLYDLSQTRE
jgi:glutamate carboxypeptidase